MISLENITENTARGISRVKIRRKQGRGVTTTEIPDRRLDRKGATRRNSNESIRPPLATFRAYDSSKRGGIDIHTFFKKGRYMVTRMGTYEGRHASGIGGIHGHDIIII